MQFSRYLWTQTPRKAYGSSLNPFPYRSFRPFPRAKTDGYGIPYSYFHNVSRSFHPNRFVRFKICFTVASQSITIRMDIDKKLHGQHRISMKSVTVLVEIGIIIITYIMQQI